VNSDNSVAAPDVNTYMYKTCNDCYLPASISVDVSHYSALYGRYRAIIQTVRLISNCTALESSQPRYNRCLWRSDRSICFVSVAVFPSGCVLSRQALLAAV